jgi:hypothetical protein
MAESVRGWLGCKHDIFGCFLAVIPTLAKFIEKQYLTALMAQGQEVEFHEIEIAIFHEIAL